MTQKGNVGVKRFNRNWQDGNPLVKKDGVWSRPEGVYVKQNGEWTNTTKEEPFYDGVIKHSCIFDTIDNTYMNIPASTYPDARTTKWALSFWIKRTNYLTSRQFIWEWIYNGNNISWLEFTAASKFQIVNYLGGYVDLVTTTEVFKDCSNWYHFYFENDVTLSTAADRWKLWVNGRRLVDFDNVNYPAQDDVTNTYFFYGSGAVPCHERISTYDLAQFDISGYLADFHIIHGSLPGVGRFGKFKRGVWVPQKYEGDHGDSGFHLDFSDSSDLGKDVSGNEHDFTTANITSANQSIDTPENNFCTFDENNTGVSMTYNKDGGLNIGYSTTNWLCSAATFAINKGKWYWEATAVTDVYYGGAGIIANEYLSDINTVASHFPAAGGTGFGWILLQGYNPMRLYTSSPTYKNSTNLTGTPAAGDCMMIAFDADNNQLWVGRNGIWGLDTSRVSNPDPASGAYPMWDYADGIDTSKTDYVPYGCVYQAFNLTFNFGQNDYSYPIPTGFKRLCTANLDEPTIEIPKKYFDVATWTGNGLDKQEISIPSGNGLEFSPDLVILKNRDLATQWGWFDVRRGPHRHLTSEDVDAEDNWSQYGFLSSFDDNGFTVSGGSTNLTLVNTDDDRYVSWNWKIGADFGVDVVLYDGTASAQNINHNLGKVPKMIMVKNRGPVYNWSVYHYGALNKTDPETDFGVLNLTAVWADLNTLWNDTAPTDTQFTVGTVDNVNADGDSYIAYLFADVPGFCKVFSYEGSGNANGPYINCGFKPKFILYKNADNAYNWRIYDTTRNPYNGVNINALFPDLTNVDTSDGYVIDITSNGYHIITAGASINQNGYTHIGVAFAENPWKYSNAG